jgi:hypothetical protein
MGCEMEIMYELIREDEQMAGIANAMICYAQLVDFDYKKAVEDAQQDTEMRTETVGPMMRVRGQKQPDSLKKYTRFLAKTREKPYQVTYVEMPVPDINGRAAQLTLVDNFHNPISQEDADYFQRFFFPNGEVKRIEGPPEHVVVLVQLR